jgi:hypothetical protein
LSLKQCHAPEDRHPLIKDAKTSPSTYQIKTNGLLKLPHLLDIRPMSFLNWLYFRWFEDIFVFSEERGGGNMDPLDEESPDEKGYDETSCLREGWS